MEAASVVAHKRGGRSRAGADGNASPSSSTTSSTRLRTPPVPESPTAVPDSPRSAEDEVKTATVWFQHGPSDEPDGTHGPCGTDIILGPSAPLEPCPPVRRVGGHRGSKTSGLSESLARVGDVTMKSASSLSSGQRRQHNESIRALPSTRGVNTGSGTSQLELGAMKGADELHGPGSRRCDATASMLGVGGVGVGWSRVAATAAAVRDRASMSVGASRHLLDGDQQVDDLTDLGDILLAQDDPAPDHRGNLDATRGAGPMGTGGLGVGTRGSSGLGPTWSHAALSQPLSNSMFPQESSGLGSSFAQDNHFLGTSWASVGGDRGGWPSPNYF